MKVYKTSELNAAIPPRCPCTLSLPSCITHACSTLAAPANGNVPVSPATRHRFSSGLGATGKNPCCSASETPGRCWVPWCSLRSLGQFLRKIPEPVGQAASPHGPLAPIHRSHVVFPTGLLVGTTSDTHTRREGAQPSAVKTGFCQGAPQSQGSSWEPPGKDELICWSSPERALWCLCCGSSPCVDSPGGARPCLQHFSSSSASLPPAWTLAGSGVLQPGLGGVSHLPPVPLPPLPSGDGFTSLAAKTARLQLGFHQCLC